MADDRLRTYLSGLRPWSQRLAGLALLTPACVVSVLLRTQEQPALLTVTALLLDRMLLPISFLLAVSVVVLVLGPWPWARTVGLLAGGLGVAIGIAACLSIRQPIEYAGLALAVATLLSSGVLIVLILKRQRTWSEFRVPRVAVLLAGLLAMLPVVQFWHVASFVPSRLSTTLGATVTTSAVPASSGAHGIIKVKVTNSGDVGALILASELVVCNRTGPATPKTADALYADPACVTDQIFENLTEIDARSTWEVQSALRPPKIAPRRVGLVEATVLLWYARQDRLKVGDSIDRLSDQDDVSACSSQNNEEDVLAAYVVQADSRPQALVQKQRRLVYLRQGEAGDAYFAFQARGERVCDATDHGRPMESTYPIGEAVGVSYLRLNYESWLTKK